MEFSFSNPPKKTIMNPNISFFLQDFFGINIPLPIQTFGFFVALAFVISSWTLKLELKRKEKEGHVKAFTSDKLVGKRFDNLTFLLAALVGFLIGYKLLFIINDYHQLVNDPQGVILSLKGHFLGGVIGAIANLYLKHSESKKQELEKPKLIKETTRPFELVGNITVIAALAGIIGAKIFHNLENIDDFMADPVGQLLGFSGLTFYGGLICGAASVIWYAKKYNINYKHLSDAAAPGLMLAYGIGRMGCHFSGDGDWGINNLAPKPEWMSFLPDWMWAYNYPNNVLNAGIPIEGCVGNYCNQLAIPVFPTAVYEIIMALSLFALLWSIRKKIQIPGMLFGIYMMVNGIERFFIEKIRVNTKYILFGNEITQAEIISFCLFITGATIVWILYRKNKNQTQSV
jgi:prolipoprotein diacylglyceryltransferase